MAHQKRNPSGQTPEPIAIVGMGCRLPGGVDGPESFWELLCAGTDTIREVPPDRWAAGAFFGKGKFRSYSRWGGFLDEIRSFDAGFFGLGMAEAEQMDPQQRILLEIAWHALEDAGLPVDRRTPSRIGVFIGASTHDYADIQFDTHELCAAGAYTATGGAQSIISNRLSYCLNLTGPSFTVDTACSSSLVSLHLAVQSLRAGECDAAMAGGVNLLLGPNNFVAFSSLSALSHDGRCKSFDASGDGFVRAEGAGVVVLKRLSDALASGDRIYATVLATGLNQDGRTAGIAMPNAAAQEALVRETWQAAGITPASVCYVEAHGTGTAVGDPVECKALGAVAREGRRPDAPCLLGSAKSNLGHLESGAGVVGLMKLALVLYHGEAPPSLHFRVPNPNIDFPALGLKVVTGREPLPVLAQNADGRPLYLGAVNSFGFGGSNAHALLSSVAEPSATPTSGEASRKPGVLLLSAPSEEGLRALAAAYQPVIDALEPHESDTLTALCRAAATRRAHLPRRLAVIADDSGTMGTRISEWLAGGEPAQVHSGEAADAARAGVTFVYSGQGPQWWAMGRQLWETQPVFRRTIEACDEHLRGLTEWSLVDELLRREDDSRMDETAIAQPAIFALQAGITELLRSWGLPPAAAIGHSVGEAAAAWAAGALSLRQGIRLMYHRGRAMAVAHGRGTLLALGVDESSAMDLVAPHPDRLALAAVNAPRSVTLSGERDLLEALKQQHDEAGVFARFVPVEYPFHSPFMDPARDELLSALADLDPARPVIPLFSTVTAEIVSNAGPDAAYWWRNVREPVRFAPAIRNMIRSGRHVFLEISAHPALVHSLRECLEAEDTAGIALPTLRRDGLDTFNLLGAVAQLHCRGAPVDWAAFFGGRGCVRPDLPRYPWQRKAYWRESPQIDGVLRTARPHPFLWRRMGTPAPSWEMLVDPVHHSYLAHHVVQGRTIFPGAGYLEGALAIASQTLDAETCVTIEEVRFEAMLPIGNGDSPPRLHLQSLDGGTRFAIHSRSPDPQEPNWTRHAVGRLRIGGLLPAACETSLLERPPGEAVEIDPLYERLRVSGLEYGPAFRVIHSAWRMEKEVLCALKLPRAARVDGEHYRIHPALLDGCFQSLFVAVGPQGTESPAYVPVAIGRMVVAPQPVGERVWCRLRRILHSEGELRCDIDVFGPQGQGLAVLENCAFKALRGSGASQAAARAAAGWYRTEWVLQPLEAAGPDLPGPAVTLSLARGMAGRSGRRPRQSQATRLREIESGLRLLLEKPLAVDLAPGPLAAAIASWAEPAAGAVNWQSLLRENPAFFAEIDLWRRLSHLPDVFSGTEPVLDHLLDSGAITTLEHYDGASPTWTGINRSIAETIASLLRQFPEGRPVRVLEFGARTGALALELHRQRGLPPGTRYHCRATTEGTRRIIERQVKGLPRIECPTCEEPDESFDLVILRGPDGIESGTVRQLTRWLHRGGHLLAADPSTLPASARLLERLLANRSVTLADTDWSAPLKEAGCHLTRSRRGGIDWTLARMPAKARRPRKRQPGLLAGRNWLLVHPEGDATAERITAELQHQGAKVARMTAKRLVALTDPATDLAHVHGVMHLAAPARPTGSSEFEAAAEAQCLEFLEVVQTLGDRDRIARPPQLVLVTRGAFPAGQGLTAGEPTQAALAGLARVVVAELPDLSCRTIDLSPEPLPSEILQLVRELSPPDSEEQVAFRVEARYVPRVDRQPEVEVPFTALADPGRFRQRVWSARPGILDRLGLFWEECRAPGPGEVEIEVCAAGLNFRDVMKALGIYPTDIGDGNILGDECAGVVRAVGSGVGGFAVGDRVMAIAPGCFGNRAVARAELVLPLPRGWDFAEGATVLIVYLTAYYALFHLGRLRAGERVLVHAGTGGVGMAAVHLAQRAGAEVYTTAGSESKRTLLRDLGVARVFDSRSLDFADQIRACTQGEGVDIVLNSLAGEAIHQGLSLLRPYGRFLEIGKRDIYEHGSLDLGPFRNALSYFAIDLARMMNSGEAAGILGEMRRLFSRSDIRPLPFRTFALEHVQDAFRFMAEARHIGKVVLTAPLGPVPAHLPDDVAALRCRPDRSYVVTGGLRGFGLATAEWLVERGARSLFLLSRGGTPDATGEAALERLRELGAQIDVRAVDVSSREALSTLLNDARKTAPIGGVVHAAAVYEDEMLLQCSRDAFRKVFGAKALGGWLLHELTLHDTLDFFVLYSSISALIGNPGQGSYVTANAFLDGLAETRRAADLPALSVGWDRIVDTGYVARNERLGNYMDRIGFGGLESGKALKSLGQALGRAVSGQLVVTEVAWNDWLKQNRLLSASPRFERLRGSAEELVTEDLSESGWLRMLLELTPAERLPTLLTQLRNLLARMLSVSPETLEADKPLDQLGLDSLTLVELVMSLESRLGIPLPTGLLAGSSGGQPMTLEILAQSLLNLLENQVQETDDRGSAFSLPRSGDPSARLLADACLPPELVFPEGARPADPGHDPILITGANGFLGIYLLAELVRRTRAPIFALVRGADERAGMERIRQTLDQYQLGLNDDLAKRITVLCGDVTSERLGLPQERYDQIAGEVRAIYHNAAITNQLAPYERLRAANVDGVLEVLRFAAAGEPKTLHYTSTIAVFSPDRDGSGLRGITEDAPCDTSPHGLLGGYAESKWVAERLVVAARDRGLRTVIYRPGLVIGDARTGISPHRDYLWRIVQTSAAIGLTPEKRYPLPLARVDYVAAALVELSLHPEATGHVFHLVGKPEIDLGRIMEHMADLGYGTRKASSSDWIQEAEKRARDLGSDSIVPYLHLFPADRRQTFIDAAEVRFDTEQATGLLSARTLALACPDPDALRRNLEYLDGTGYFKPAANGNGER